MRFQIVAMAGKDKVHDSVASERDVSDTVTYAHRTACNLYRDNNGRMAADTPVITVTSTPIVEKA